MTLDVRSSWMFALAGVTCAAAAIVSTAAARVVATLVKIAFLYLSNHTG
jgi:hypothetical protein